MLVKCVEMSKNVFINVRVFTELKSHQPNSHNFVTAQV